jgi:hypothetical protein
MLVAERNGRLCCRGIPTIVTIRASSLRSAPRLAARLPRSGYECFLTRREALRRAPSRTRRRHRYAISPSQLCDLAGTTAWPGGTVAAILFPVIRPREGGARLRELGAVAARRRIRTGLFRAGLPPIRDAAFGPASRPRSARGTLARAVANRVPCFELELGRGARADRSWIARLGALIGPRGTRARGAVR